MSVPETAEKIKSMEIRGPAGLPGLLPKRSGTMRSRFKCKDLPAFTAEMEKAAEMLVATRPTAVSLPNAVHIVMAGLDRAKDR